MKKTLLATTAIVGLVLAASPAKAFDSTTWDWTKTVTENVTVDVDIDSFLEPLSHVEIQKVTTFEGDIRAEARFEGDYLSDDSTEFTIDEDALADLNDANDIEVNGTFTLSGEYDANATGPNVTNAEISDLAIDGFDGELSVDAEGSEVSVQPSNYEFNMAINGVLAAEGDDISLDDINDLIEEDEVTLDAATELPTLVGDATAIANYDAFQTEGATFLDVAQDHIAANALGESGVGVQALAHAGTVDAPVEAAVDLTATAISNYLSVEGAATGADNIMIADLSQTTNANVEALAVAYQDLSGYNGLGGFGNIAVDEMTGVVGNLSATAIGNYSSIKFGPSVDLTDPLDQE